MNNTREILNPIDLESMDDIPHYLYLRDIVGETADSENLKALKEKILQSKWVQKVISQQWKDGSWGRFHSLSTSTDTDFTTESAIRRLLILGLDKSDTPIKKALSYIESYLRGEIELRDYVEKKHDWTLLTRLFVTTWIRIIDREHTLAQAEAKKWADVVSAAFENQDFNESRYIEAYKDILHPEKGKYIWGILNFYIVALLPGLLSETVEDRFIEHIMNSKQGIYYIYDGNLTNCPSWAQSKQVVRFLTAHELLSKYTCYPKKAHKIKDWLRDNRTPDGLWDFGTKSKDGVHLPLSKSWRKQPDRKTDCTFKVLRLLKRLK